MWAYNVNWFITKVIFWPVNIVSAITTLVGGVILALPLVGLVFMLAFQIIWIPTLGAILATGWFWHKAPPGLRSLAVPLGVPLAIIGNICLSLMPAGSDPEDRFGKRVKQTLCQSWPWAANLPADGYLVDAVQAQGKSFPAAAFEYAEWETRRLLGIA